MASTETSRFGNTLSELQSGITADKAVTFGRQNNEDATSQARLEAFLKLRGQQLEAQAKKSEAAAARAQQMQALIQQDKQFGTTEENRMKLGQLEADTRLKIAQEKGVDPRMFQNFNDIQALNNENMNKVKYAQQLSDARKAAVKAKKAPMAESEDTWGWRNKPYKDRVSEAEAIISQIDAQASKLGYTPAEDGGLVVPTWTPIPLPDFGRSSIPVQGGTATAPAQGQLPPPAMMQGGGVSIGGVPVNNFIDSVPVAPAVIGSSPATNYWDFSNGALAPR